MLRLMFRSAKARSARKSAPGVILLDLAMPEVDGFEVVALLQAEPAWRTIPVVVVTGKDLSAEERARLNGRVERMRAKGAAAREPLLDELRQLVAACLGRRRGRT